MNQYLAHFRRINGRIKPMSYKEAKDKFEKEYLETLLRWANGNVRLASKQAKRDRKGLYVLLKKHGIDPNDFRLKKKESP